MNNKIELAFKEAFLRSLEDWTKDPRKVEDSNWHQKMKYIISEARNEYNFHSHLHLP